MKRILKFKNIHSLEIYIQIHTWKHNGAQWCTWPPPRQGLSNLFFFSPRLRLRVNFGTGMHHGVDCVEFPFTDFEIGFLSLASIITTSMLWRLLIVGFVIDLPCSLLKLSWNNSNSSFFLCFGDDGSASGASMVFGRHSGVLPHDGVLSTCIDKEGNLYLFRPIFSPYLKTILFFHSDFSN